MVEKTPSLSTAWLEGTGDPMSNALSFSQHAVFTKITAALSADPNPPSSMSTMGFWLARNLEAKDFEELDAVEQKLGEEDANRFLCDAMERSGKYGWDPVTDEVYLV